MKKNNMLPRICKNCGNVFSGGPRAWYCPGCREERKRQQDRRHKQLVKAGEAKHVGDILQCIDCGKDYEYRIGSGSRCPECAKIHLKMTDNRQSREWNKKNREKCLEAKRAYDRRKREKGI